MKYIATIKYTEQVSPDDYEQTMRHLEVKPETLVSELITWMKKFDQGRVRSLTVREVDEK
jgi:hypothetical protein